ncbi:IclR family transcriptional regulator [Minwuia thermotolerans]|uniref:IclR family transcriptional regulator n=1 Tax=Minwuia thermotolerans TaxID=2056226 RepID=A0A2M9G7Q4_9PROT|nr:IclR family transcriptional regulator [Minwuia thermotolerans]PJK31732.1 hypothetical protein CVT23_00110 [Minwuia thermotolerans]
MSTIAAISHESKGAPRAGPQSVRRVLRVLERLAVENEGVSLAELAAVTETPKTSLIGLLQGLTAENCLARDGAGHYRLGPQFLALATRVVFGRELVATLRPVLAELAAATGETAVLAALSGDGKRVTYLDRVESDNPIRYAVRVGEQREMHCTAGGKILLAHFDNEALDRYLANAELRAFTDQTITSRRKLRTELKRTRAEGLARTCDEGVVGASAIAAPVLAPDGSVAAALLIAGPTERMRRAAKDNERSLREAAARCNWNTSTTTGRDRS